MKVDGELLKTPACVVTSRSRIEVDGKPLPDADRARLIAEYQDAFANPYVAAERGFIDDVIEPAETRVRLVRALRMLGTKREAVPARKHGNIPL